MPVPQRITPRQPTKELGILSPSERVSFTDIPVGNVQLQPSRFVDQPTPYVAKAAQRTDLDQLAEGLTIFNKTIGSINYQRQIEYVKGQEEQGAIDAAADPQKLREVFRNGLDAATEQGLFPKYAHPRYRMAYMQAGAKQMALGDLPAYLDEQTKGLSDAGNTTPIADVVRSATATFAKDNNITDPATLAQYNSSAWSAVLQKESQISTARDKNIVEETQRQTFLSGMNEVGGLISAYGLENQNDRELAVENSTRRLQGLYDNMRASDPNNATKNFTDVVIAGVKEKVSSGTLTARDAITVLDDLSPKLKAGTGPWAYTEQAVNALDNARSYFENRSIQFDSIAKGQKKERETATENAILNKFQELDAAGKLDTISSEDLFSSTVQAASSIGDAEFGADPVAAQRKMRELHNDFNEMKQAEKSYVGLDSTFQNEIDNDPKTALSLLGTLRDGRRITSATYDKWAKIATDSLDTGKYLDEGGYSKKFPDIEGSVKSMYAAGGGLGQWQALTSDQTTEIAELRTFGEQAFRVTATKLVSKALREDPSLRKPENIDALRQKSAEAVDEAYTTTIKAVSERKKEMQSKIPIEESKAKEAVYGNNKQKIALLEDAVDNLQRISPSGLTNPQTIDFKARIARVPEQLKYIAGQISMATDKTERDQLTATYKKMAAISGYGPAAVLNGKTEDGIDVPIAEIKANPNATPIFRNTGEFKAVVDAHFAGGEVLPSVDLVSFVKNLEGFSQTAYWDNKQWSIGYGTRGAQGESLTQEEAQARLSTELNSSAQNIDAAAAGKGVILTEPQRNALISFDYNTGAGASVVESFGGDPAAMKKKILEYVYETKGGQKVKSNGLVNRRLKEVQMFDLQSADLGGQMPQEQGTTLGQLFTMLGLTTQEQQDSFLRSQKALSAQRTLNF